MEKWLVISWAGNEMYGGKQFDSFEDGRAYIWEMAEKLCESEKDREDYAGDMYCERVKE